MYTLNYNVREVPWAKRERGRLLLLTHLRFALGPKHDVCGGPLMLRDVLAKKTLLSLPGDTGTFN
jgi:hypothetical protein